MAVVGATLAAGNGAAVGGGTTANLLGSQLFRPDTVRHILQLQNRVACCSAFSHTGIYVGIGCSDGAVLVWDFETLGIIAEFLGHARTVVDVSWSADNRLLLSASTDFTVVVWSLESMKPVHEVRFPGPVLGAAMHPSLPAFVCCCLGQPPFIVDLHANESYPLVATDHRLKAWSGCLMSSHGDAVFAVNSIGGLACFDWASRTEKFAHSSATVVPILTFAKSSDDKTLCLVCDDRFLRLYSAVTHTVTFQLQDPVSKCPWKSCAFSADGGVLVAVPSASDGRLYFWSVYTGVMIDVHQGPRDRLYSVTWHPKQPMLLACSARQLVYVWEQSKAENWAACAPNFKELVGNEEYKEAEDEFDVVTEAQALTSDVPRVTAGKVPPRLCAPIQVGATEGVTLQAPTDAATAEAATEDIDMDVDILGGTDDAPDVPQFWIPARLPKDDPADAAGSAMGAGTGARFRSALETGYEAMNAPNVLPV